jgi:CrcB protein
MTVLYVAIFGAMGACVRWVAEYAVRRHHPVRRPWATVGANALGCCIAGWATSVATTTLTTQWHQIVVTGLCGGLTTFSSAFAIPALIAREHAPRYAITIVSATAVLTTAAFLLGLRIG